MRKIKEVRMRDEASCILASLQLSDFADPRVDDVLVWLDLVVGLDECRLDDLDEEDYQGEDCARA
jgi:hypothetical protein